MVFYFFPDSESEIFLRLDYTGKWLLTSRLNKFTT